MRILVFMGLLIGSGQTLALDAAKQAMEDAHLPSISDGRFALELRLVRSVPSSADGRFTLNSDFDPPAIQAPSDGRYTLNSTLVSKVGLGACGTSLPEIFRNGFEP